MFLPQQQPKEEKPQIEEITIPEPPILLRLKTVNRLSIYGFWFLLGVAIANLSRLIPNGWILYWVFQLASSGYLMFVPPSDASESAISIRRISGFALLLSATALWDWVVAVINLPIHVFLWILPAWQLVGLGIVGLILLGIFIGLVT